MINNRNYYISELYEAYPILAQIDKNNDGILSKRATFKELLSDEYLTTHEGECIGFLFVLSGNIKVQKSKSLLLNKVFKEYLKLW